MEKDFLHLIQTRRSCRSYRPEQIADEQLEAILQAGTYAPSAMGAQSPYIVAVQNPGQIAQLSAMNARVMNTSADPYYGAPTLVLVFAPQEAKNAVQDASCVLENMMLAAHALGVGSCWINREREMFANVRYRRGPCPDETMGTSRGPLRGWCPVLGLSGSGTLAAQTPQGGLRAGYPLSEGGHAKGILPQTAQQTHPRGCAFFFCGQILNFAIKKSTKNSNRR